jgi:hypothetical protein
MTADYAARQCHGHTGGQPAGGIQFRPPSINISTEALVYHWHSARLSAGALKKRMSLLRWWAQKVRRENFIARDSTHCGIPDRRFVAAESQATLIDQDDYIRMSLELQRAFGPRREEAIKFQPRFARTTTITCARRPIGRKSPMRGIRRANTRADGLV